MVGDGEVEAEQAEDEADQPLGLAQGQAEHRPQRQGRSDRQGGVVRLPPRMVRGSAFQAAIASSLNHIVRLPRWRSAASYAGQLVTRCAAAGCGAGGRHWL
jgi:hypothetical protein